MLPSSWPPFRQAPRSRVGPWHEGQARVDMKLGLLSRSRLQTPHPSHKRKRDLGASVLWLTVPLVSGGLEDLVTLV